ncbi:MAG TPA: hypothetical protein VEC58_05015 [Roseiarcus sp.]|jgi:hypothetical protein|nr:hypothetical protein [Roseiarcus sp.]
MRNAVKTAKIAAGVVALLAVATFGVCAEPSVDTRPSATIKVDDGQGGWTPYKPQNPPKKPPKLVAKPKPYHDKRTGWTYFLMQDAGGQQYIQIEDANGADLHFDGSMTWPNTGGAGPSYPIR